MTDKSTGIASTVSISNRGRVTIPVRLRKHMGIQGAQTIQFKVSDSGTVVISAKAKDSSSKKLGRKSVKLVAKP